MLLWESYHLSSMPLVPCILPPSPPPPPPPRQAWCQWCCPPTNWCRPAAEIPIYDHDGITVQPISSFLLVFPPRKMNPWANYSARSDETPLEMFASWKFWKLSTIWAHSCHKPTHISLRWTLILNIIQAHNLSLSTVLNAFCHKT